MQICLGEHVHTTLLFIMFIMKVHVGTRDPQQGKTAYEISNLKESGKNFKAFYKDFNDKNQVVTFLQNLPKVSRAAYACCEPLGHHTNAHHTQSVTDNRAREMHT